MVTQVVDDAILCNGMDWSPDGRLFYLVDSIRMSVDAFDFDVQSGGLSNRRRLITYDGRTGAPNGMTVDAAGDLWIALTCGGEVLRHAPDGRRLGRVKVSVPGVTSCAFGGPDLDVLFITSRSGRVPDIIRTLGVPEALLESAGPEAGGLFACRTGANGRPPYWPAC